MRTVACPHCSPDSLEDVSRTGCRRCFGTGRTPEHVVQLLRQIRSSRVTYHGRDRRG